MNNDDIMSVVSEPSTVCFMNDRGDDEVIQIWRSIRMQQMGWMEKEYDEALNAAARTRIWVYLLVSSKGRKFVGKTKHPIRYLKEHNSGKTKSTKPRDGEVWFEVAIFGPLHNGKAAYALKKFIKSGSNGSGQLQKMKAASDHVINKKKDARVPIPLYQADPMVLHRFG